MRSSKNFGYSPTARVANMSKLAPSFSAIVIGSETETADESADWLSPKKDFFSARSVNAATSTMPAPVIHTATGKVFHAPRRIVISAATPLNPGMPIDAADAMTNETHVAHARIVDDKFQIALAQRHGRGVENSDHGKDSDPFTPHVETLREKI